MPAGSIGFGAQKDQLGSRFGQNVSKAYTACGMIASLARLSKKLDDCDAYMLDWFALSSAWNLLREGGLGAALYWFMKI